jgi:hypothetical protein
MNPDGTAMEAFDAHMDAVERQRFAALAKAVADRRDQQAFSELFDYFAPRLKSWLTAKYRSTLP